MKKFTRFFLGTLLMLVFIQSIRAQCTLGDAYGSGTAASTCNTVTASPSCHYIDEYAQFTGLTIGNTYEIGSNVPGTSSATTVTAGAHELTLFDGTGAVLTSQTNATNNLINITFTATTTTVRVQMNTSGCGITGSYCHYYGLRCTSCSGPGAPTCPTLTAPTNNATGISTLPTLTWSAATNATAYDVYIDADATCSITPTTLVATVSTTSYTLTSSLSPSTNYRWMIVPKDCSGAAPASCTPFCFTTTVAPPANDNCTGTNGTPVALTPQSFAAACSSPVAATTVGATQSNTNCSSTATNDDVWFSFTANATTQTVRFEGVTAVTGTVTSMGMDTYTTCGGTNSNCNTGVTLTSGAGQANLTGLTIGTTYFLRVWTAGTSNSATFNICIIDPPPPPANDECAGAVALTPQAFVASGCPGSVSGTTLGATQTTTPPTTNWPSSGDDDVWYSFTATQTSHIIRFCNVTYPVGTAVNMSIELHPDCASAAIAGTGLTATITSGTGQTTLTGLTIGVNYRLRVLTSGSTSRANFDISVIEPQPMTYVSSTTTQQTGTAGAGSVDNTIIRIDITVINLVNPLSITSFTLNTNGTSVPADISNAKIYYTGTSTTFSTANLFGSFANPNGSFTITGSQALTGGASNTVNYFWLAYDLSCAAAGPNLDGECNSFVIGGGSQTPTVQAPSGNKTVTALTSYTTGANGNWSAPSTWLCGVPPSGTTTPIVINHNVDLDVNVDFNANLTINAGRTLSVSSNTLTVGPVGGGNRSVTVNGTLNNSGGTINVNGNVAVSGAFIMSNGFLNIDGNSGVSGTSVASGTNLLNITSAASNHNISGGTITFVDPHFSASSSSNNILAYSGTGVLTATGGLVRFGDGASTQVGTGTGGFSISPNSSAGFRFYDAESNGGSTTNRHSYNYWDMAVFNTFTINAGSEHRMGDDLYITQNLVNNGILTSSTSYTLCLSGINASGATVTSTANAISISGSGTYRNSTTPTANLGGLVVNTTNSAGVTLPSTMLTGVGTGSVSNTLTLTNGVVNLSGGTLTLGISTSTVGTLTHTNGWINGTFNRWVATSTGARDFPVGTATTKRNGIINFTTGQTTGGVLSTSFFDSDPGTAGLPMTWGGITVEAVSPSGYWQVDRVSGAGGTYSGTFDCTNFTQVGGAPITLLSNVRMIRRPNAGNWDGSTGTATAPTNLNAVALTGQTTFSQFALGGTFTALPLELSFFNGKTLASSNLLSWETALEKDVQWHIVERAADGVNFSEVGRLAGQLVSNNPTPYQLEDLRPIGKAYYRLRSVDLDGKETLSSVIVLERKGARFQIDNVFPSPTQGDLTVQFNAVEESSVNVMVHDFSGRLVLQQQLDAAKGFNQTTLQLGSLPAGMYNVTIFGTQSATEPVRIVKE